MYKLAFSKAAAKVLARMPRHVSRRILERLKKIALDPFAVDGNVEPMSGMPAHFRLRSGDGRARYRIERRELRILVIKIAPRGGVYQ